ncbi:MAG: DUF1015 domain-containing protein [Phycisphaerae bacterium]|nr:DUF1015 domain-containing protein [Phycisphaerae bacterium]
MAQIRPLKAIRFNTQQQRDLSCVLAPPYDVIDADLRDELIARDQHNIVHIDLPHMPPSSLGPPAAYARSAQLLKDWLDRKVLVTDPQPGLYYYQQTFKIGSASHTRKAFFCRVRLEPLGEGAVKPHEHTFSGPKEDRLALTKATCCNLSPVFGLYPDQNNQALDALKPSSAEPDCFADLDGIRNELWLVREPQAINRAVQLLADKKIYIADGHHRYSTALNYRDFLRQSGQSIPDEHGANFVNMALVSTADPGLVILPTHRLVVGLADDFLPKFRSLTSSQFNWTESGLDVAKADQFESALARAHRRAIGLYEPCCNQLLILSPKSDDPVAQQEPQKSPALRDLAVVILHDCLLSEKITSQLAPSAPPQITYVKDIGQAVRSCRQGQHQAAFLLQPTSMEQVLAVVEAGELMPHKSTFFYPKIPTGLVINPLY